MKIRRVDKYAKQELTDLIDVLIDCVDGGSSVGFMLPMTREKAENFWLKVFESAKRGERILLVAENSWNKIVGTVQVILDLPENQPHRGEVAKMLVHHSVRRQGLGAKLLAAAEEAAQHAQKNLLVLDTASGSDAERLYERSGWEKVGKIPKFALFPNGELCSTTIFYKRLEIRREISHLGT